MGRKIPAKKHRGVKDPLKQQAQRLLSLKSKINAPPKDPDEQPVPRSLTQLFEYKNKHEKNQKLKKKNIKRLSPKENIVVRDNPVSKLRKVAGESARAFSLRINSAIRTLNNDQHDYPQDIEEEGDRKGERLAFQRERKEKKRKRAATNSQDGDTEETPKLSRTQKLTLKKKAKKLKAAEKCNESEVMYERVGFGEVAHAPPSLSIKPRRAQPHDAAPRPGRRDLLLSKLLTGNTGSSTVTGSKMKEKDLPIAERMRRERARLDAVTAYRSIKKNKLNKT